MPFALPVQKTPNKFMDIIMNLGGLTPFGASGEWNYLRSSMPKIGVSVAKAAATRGARQVSRMLPETINESVIIDRLRRVAQSGRMDVGQMKDALVNAATAGKVKPEMVNFFMNVLKRVGPGAQQIASEFARETQKLGAPIVERMDEPGIEQMVQFLRQHFMKGVK